MNEEGDQRPVRMEIARRLLAQAPPNRVGEYTYSNAGYIIVGAAMERITGQSWEQLMNDEIFEPLGMEACGFGGAARPGSMDQPWAHRRGRQGENAPVDPSGIDDNPRSLGPAGTVHCSMDAWKSFLDAHVGHGPIGYLSARVLDDLHAPYPESGSGYGGGWLTLERPWGDGRVLSHSGSNTMNYATAWIAPEINAGLMVATNVAYDGINADLDAIIQALIISYIHDR